MDCSGRTFRKICTLLCTTTLSAMGQPLLAHPLSAQPLSAQTLLVQPAPPVQAQTAASPTEQAGTGLEEIVVTARKRDENIQDTPISITAFTASGLEARNANNLAALGDLTPNLTVNPSAAFTGSSQIAVVFIRGIGQTDFTLNTDPGVGTYVDGVYISRAVGGLLDLGDVERVEVLRGPQGTLFGKNTIGGAVSITTSRPSFEYGGKASALYGNDDWVQLSGSVTGPLSDKVAAKLFARYERRDGYVERTTDGLDLGNKNSVDFRGGLLFKPVDDLSILVNGDYARSRENGAPLVPVAINPDALFPTIHNALIAPGLVPTLGAGAFYNAQYLSNDLYKVQGNSPAYSDADVWGGSMNVEYELGSTTIRSITAYRDVSSSFARDGDGSPLQINSTQNDYKYNQISQEFQLLGKLADDRLNYILGLYYLREKGSDVGPLDFGFVAFQSGGRVTTNSYAGFGQLNYKLTDALTLTGGLRYTDENRSFTPNQFIIAQRVVLPIPPFPPEAGVLNQPPGTFLVAPGTYEIGTKEWTPMANLSFKPSESSLLYATYSQGFKGAGFSQRIYPINLELGPNGPTGRLLGPSSFTPEQVKVYEAGFKYTTPDRRLRVNGSAFYTDYSNLQVTVQVGVAPTTQNAAAAEIKGFELEGQFVPIDHFKIDFGAGFTDAKYTELDARVTGITLDSKLPGTSKWTANTALSYDFGFGDGSQLTPRVDVSYRSKYFFDANNAVSEDGYGIFNASLSYAMPSSGITITGLVKNIGNTVYFVHGESIFAPGGFTLVTPARRREWAVRVSKTF